MKIIYVDTSISGHHLTYLNGLVSNDRHEYVLILPEQITMDRDHKQYVCKNHGQTLKFYFQWLKEIENIVKKEKPDVIHFLYGDLFYKFFGIGLGRFKNYKIIMTMHWLRTKKIEQISMKMISRKTNKIVVHSSYIKKMLCSFGIKNVEHIEYPRFNIFEVDQKVAYQYFGLHPEIPVISCVGNTRKDKGLDILLEALNTIELPFQLLIAGKEDGFTKEFILEKTKSYSEKVFLHLHYLTDEELAYAFSVADVIVLPYRKNFNGASGPLGEGVWLNKCILGPDHGNLGDTIRTNHLGYTFESENPQSLAFILSKCLSNAFKIDSQYIQYREALNPEEFKQSYMRLYNII